MRTCPAPEKEKFQKFTYDDVEQVVARGLVKGMSFSQATSFLEANGLKLMNYVEVAQQAAAAPSIKAILYSGTLQIERRPLAFFEVFLRLAFNDRKELVEWTIKKNRR